MGCTSTVNARFICVIMDKLIYVSFLLVLIFASSLGEKLSTCVLNTDHIVCSLPHLIVPPIVNATCIVQNLSSSSCSETDGWIELISTNLTSKSNNPYEFVAGIRIANTTTTTSNIARIDLPSSESRTLANSPAISVAVELATICDKINLTVCNNLTISRFTRDTGNRPKFNETVFERNQEHVIFIMPVWITTLLLVFVGLCCLCCICKCCIPCCIICWVVSCPACCAACDSDKCKDWRSKIDEIQFQTR